MISSHLNGTSNPYAQQLKASEYFEKQKSFTLQCGLHSINNIFRKPTYTKNDLVSICNELSGDIINPHKHIFGGDYDANVIIIALQRKGYICEWIDRRKPFGLVHYLNEIYKTGQPLNFLLNRKSPRKFYHHMLRFSSRHWFIIREKSNQQFQICDSNEEKPIPISKNQQLENYLKEALKNGTQLIWVHKSLTAKQ